MAPIRLTLISRQDCHLCDEMVAVIDQVRPRLEVQLTIVDVDADPVLRAAYSDQVPVLLIEDRKAFKYRVTARQLERRLRAERRRSRLRRWRARLAGARSP